MAEESAARRLEALMKMERQALLAGKIDAITVFEEERGRLLAEVSQTASADALHRLRGLAERNAGLAGAAAEGIRDAIRRLGEIRGAAGPIASYSASGKPARIGESAPTLERKA